MVEFTPNSWLSSQLCRSINTADDAQEQLYLIRMLDVARLIRDPFPDATAIVIDARNLDVEPKGLELHSVLCRDDELWNAADQQPSG